MRIMRWIGEKLAFGFVFGIGVFLAVEGGQRAEKKIKRIFYSKEYIQYSGGNELEISDHSDIRDMREYIIGGVIKNNTEDSWKNVTIDVVVLKSGIEVDRCQKELGFLAANSTESFSVVCDRVFPERVTKDYTYTIEISYASRRV
ncbi:FxLYD domain-containing protein [Microbulbifer sp. EKSA008]|uniref:FxLYD domain-containing protein n=1 Tax=unclassified Microbulbifer TaxID=2619833 RepID=UPI0039B6533E